MAALLTAGATVARTHRRRVGVGINPLDALRELNALSERVIGELDPADTVSVLSILAGHAGGSLTSSEDHGTRLREVCQRVTATADRLDAAVAELGR